jgi:DNA-binding HxlR family transcriptional regulator
MSNKQAINATIDLLQRKWVMRIIWELREDPLTFRQLQEACGKISPTSLNKRLNELREYDLIEHIEMQGYQLTNNGQRLLIATMPLIDWAAQWWGR